MPPFISEVPLNEQSAVGTVIFEVVLLTIIVLLVDEPLIRGGLAAIPALLIAQRTLRPTGPQELGEWTPADDQRMDAHVREHVTKLLGHFRDFYTMCHLVGSGKIGAVGAATRANDLEKELNALLDELTSGARELAGVPLVATGAAVTEMDGKLVAPESNIEVGATASAEAM